MRDFKPPSLLRDAHIQSLLASSALRRRRVLREAQAMLCATRDELIDCGEGVRLLARHTRPAPGRAMGRLAIMIHGWEGSADSSYLLASANRLWLAGYRVLRLNLRDHGDSHHLNRELFHSCRLDEVIGAVRAIQSRFRDESLMLGGFSLGGNFALRVAAAADESGLRIDRVAAVCPVLDPAETMQALDDGWIAYRWYFIRKWRRSLERKREAFPRLYDFGDLRRFRTLCEMTEFFVANYTEYPDLTSYLGGYALTGERLAKLRVPSHALLAEDDPVIPVKGLQRMALPSALHIERADFGGHCGFLSDYRLGSRLDLYPLQVFGATQASPAADSE